MLSFEKIWNGRRVLRSIFHTIWFNFHYLPFRQAVKLPIWLYKPHLYRCDGTVVLDVAKVKAGMVRLGFLIETLYPNNGIVWDHRGGKVIFRGECIIGNNSSVKVGKKASLEIGDGFQCTAGLKLLCVHSVSFGEHVLVGWENTIMDTDYHRVKSITGEFVGSAIAPVSIGHHAWLCCQVLTLKGAEVPPRCIVGAGTVVNKKFDAPEHSLIAGNPARIRKSGIRMDVDDPRTNELFARS